MLWVKSFHIVFVASWFAGLFYLPRIFVNLAMVDVAPSAERERLLLMARKLLRFTHILSVVAGALGVWLWSGYGIGWGEGNAWMDIKLFVVLLVLLYQYVCARMLALFVLGHCMPGHVWVGWFYEIPCLLRAPAVVRVFVHRVLTGP